MNKNLSVDIAGIKLKNPVTVASGTFGAGREYREFFDLSKLGAITIKGVSKVPWKGNDTPRIAETYGGMLNSVGLQNSGVDFIKKYEIPFLKQYDTKIIVNVCGHTIKEYCEVVESLNNETIDLLELNISCPNIKDGGISFGTDPIKVEQVVKEVKKYAKQPLIVKLSPNVTDITQIAKAAVSGGADALSLINTLLGMKIDVHKRKPVLANKVGGLSGPAIKPVAVRMVYQVAQVVNVPIIGMGGIMTGEDAIEFILAGATMVAVGTANFTNPYASVDVLKGIENYMEKYGIDNITKLRGEIL